MEKLVNRQSYWIRSGEAQLMTHAHLPANAHGSAAVLLCTTIGFEAIHAYRCFIRLADELAQNGVAAFRFDYSGTGNASGDANGSGLVEQWQQNIVDQLTDLRENWSFQHITVIGFRLGATLLTSVLDRVDVSGISFWEPVTHGKSFVREIRAAAQFSVGPFADRAAVLESGGFAYSDETIRSIQQLSLDSASLPEGVPVLLVSRGQNPIINSSALGERNPLSELRTREYDRMVCEPHYTELPVETIDRVISWNHSVLKSDNANFRPAGHSDSIVLHTPAAAPDIVETAFRSEPGNLFGIVSRPVDYLEGSTPTVLLSNAGSVCNIGPNRIYVQIARALAAAGLEVIRYDLRNLGDSVVGNVLEANVPYPDTASDDVEYLLQHCRTALGSKAFALAGLCSGSHTSYHFSLSHTDADVRDIILINPLTFYWTPGTSLENPLQHRTVRDAKSYARSALDSKSWQRLFTGKVDYGKLFTFTARILARTIANTVRKIGDLWSGPSLSRMDRDLLRLEERGLQVRYVFSSTDPGYWIAKVESPNTFASQLKSGRSTAAFLDDADHTLSKAQNRDDLIRVLRETLVTLNSA